MSYERCLLQRNAAVALFRETNDWQWAHVAAIFQDLADRLLDAQMERMNANPAA